MTPTVRRVDRAGRSHEYNVGKRRRACASRGAFGRAGAIHDFRFHPGLDRVAERAHRR